MEFAIQLLIVAADPLIRTSLAFFFDDIEECEVLSATSPALFLTESEDNLDVDTGLILWDLGWETGGLGGLDFQEFSLPVVSLVADPDQAIEAWNAGARGILSREMGIDDMLAALRATTNGMVVLDPGVADSLLPTPPRIPGHLHSTPTARELEVLNLLAEGLTNKAIAGQLNISEHTVKFHVNAILNKLEAQSRTEAVVIATRLGFIVL
jgi:two-component system, NarL family, nitrate/nitrite response regulator NarL